MDQSAFSEYQTIIDKYPKSKNTDEVLRRQ